MSAVHLVIFLFGIASCYPIPDPTNTAKSPCLNDYSCKNTPEYPRCGTYSRECRVEKNKDTCSADCDCEDKWTCGPDNKCRTGKHCEDPSVCSSAGFNVCDPKLKMCRSSTNADTCNSIVDCMTGYQCDSSRRCVGTEVKAGIRKCVGDSMCDADSDYTVCDMLTFSCRNPGNYGACQNDWDCGTLHVCNKQSGTCVGGANKCDETTKLQPPFDFCHNGYAFRSNVPKNTVCQSAVDCTPPLACVVPTKGDLDPNGQQWDTSGNIHVCLSVQFAL